MATTTLVVELLVTGLQAMIWMFLVPLFFVPAGYLVEIIKNKSLVDAVVVFPIAYTFGIIFDRIWDRCTKSADVKIRNKYFAGNHNVDNLRALIFTRNDTASKFIDYIRSRLRVARSSLCNLLALSIVSSVIRIVHYDRDWAVWFLYLAIIALLIAAISYYSYDQLTHTYYKAVLNIGSNLVTANAANKSAGGDQNAAAAQSGAGAANDNAPSGDSQGFSGE